MKHISDYQFQNQRPQKPETQFSDEEKRMITWIWAKLAARYDTLWTSKILDERINTIMQAEWVDKLMPYDKRSIASTVDGWMEKYPPNIQEFVDRLRPLSMSHSRFKALPQPRAGRQKALDQIAEIRRKLG